MKRSLLLVLLAISTAICGYAYDFESGGIYYNIGDNNTVSVTKGDTKYEGDIIIPSEITYNGVLYNVANIGDVAFGYCRYLTSITIPNSVKSIGNDAFCYCSGLTSVTIGNSVTSIGNDAFKYCSGLTSVTIGNSVTSIGDYAFIGCTCLTSVTIPNSVVSIGDGAFLRCYDLTSITIPGSVTSIGNGAFQECSGLTSITVSSENTNYDSRNSCNAIIETSSNTLIKACVNTVIPNSVTSIGKNAFSGCSGITSILIPNSVKTIGEGAFGGCRGLTSITIPNSVTNIESYAFNHCENLVYIYIPESVSSLSHSAFWYCDGLSSIRVDENNPYYDSRNNCNAIIRTNSNTLMNGCKNTIIPNGIKTIGQGAFMNCSDLKSIVLPDGIITIYANAFGESGIENINIPNTVTYIGQDSFAGCKNLSTITIPNSVTSIIDGAFYGCSNLIKVVSEIKNPYNINSGIFENISSDAILYVPTGTKAKYQVYEGWTKNFKEIIESSSESGSTNISFADANVKTICVANWDTNGDGELSEQEAAAIKEIGTTFKGNTTIKSFDELKYFIGLETISKRAFSGCNRLTSITIPNSVTNIGDFAFYSCRGLTSVTIGNSVISIGDQAFYNCSGLTSVTIGNSVTSIGYAAFVDCSGLTSITIPNSVTSIGNEAFENCSGLTSIIVSSGNTKYNSRNNCNAIIETSSNTLIAGCKNTIIPNSVTSIGDFAFYGCSGLTSISIPNSVTSIGLAAFYGCSGLTSISIPNSVTSIGSSTFYNCSGMTSITIGNSVMSIGSSAFSYCRGLTSIISEIPNPFQIDESVFSYISSDAKLQVPSGTKSKYEAFSGWTKNFKEIIESTTETTTYSLNITASGYGYVTYNGTTIRNNTQSFTVKEGTNATVTFTPDTGYRIKSVKLNSTDVTSSVANNKYTINNITQNTTLAVTFEAIPATTYSLSITASGNGNASYNNTPIRNNTQTFTLDEGSSAVVTFTPDNGYRLASVWVNNYNVTNSVYNNQYTINNIRANITLSVEFEAIPVTTYSLSISASGNGYVSYNGTSVRNRTTSFTVDEGASATIIFTPDNGNSISSVKLNNSDITSQISGNSYTISNITANTTLSVTFEEDVNALTVDGLNYTVTSQSNRTVTLTSGGTGQVLTVPATITQNGTTWKVTGIDKDALKGNTELSAIIWNPEAAFTATVSNPNLLLYVKSSDYAPATIQNVVVNGTASNIILAEAKSGNNFYCPQSFVAQKISYTHNYKMQTGIGEARGWETIALPFDVQTITHATKGEIKPFANWKSSDQQKPFWLMELTGTGFVETGNIKAYTPYIISMPNNPQYDNQWLLNGKVTFAASGVTVGKTDQLQEVTYKDRTFIPCYVEKGAAEGFYALNVNNDYETNNSGMTDGSRFVLNMRTVHPFEAYMTTSSNAPEWSIGIFEDMTTGIQMMVNGNWTKEEVIYNLQGRKLNNPSKKGVYIVNGKKKVIK